MNERIVHNLADATATHGVVTIGTFDGVHLGHQSLLRGAVDRATELQAPALVITFEPIPASVLRPEQFPGRICPVGDKLNAIAHTGPDQILVYEFTRESAQLSAAEFMESIAAMTHLRELWVGEEFALGRGRSGGVEQLAELGETLGYVVRAVARSEDQDGVISSSRIRNAVQLGDVSLANRLLGRPFRIAGEVVSGARFGRTIGFPTANVAPPPDQVALADGIYASRAWMPGESEPLLSMTYVGTRPSVNTGARAIETNILDFERDLYGQVLTVDLMQRLRPDAFFPSIDALVAQLRIDETATRAFFEDLHHAVD